MRRTRMLTIHKSLFKRSGQNRKILKIHRTTAVIGQLSDPENIQISQ